MNLQETGTSKPNGSVPSSVSLGALLMSDGRVCALSSMTAKSVCYLLVSSEPLSLQQLSEALLAYGLGSLILLTPLDGSPLSPDTLKGSLGGDQ